MPSAEEKQARLREEIEADRKERKRLLKQGQREGIIQVRIFSLKHGLQIYEKILMIHIKSEKYDLLIMEDYLPILGEIDGDIIISLADDEIILTDIKGFFCHEHNSFFLLLKESSNVEQLSGLDSGL